MLPDHLFWPLDLDDALDDLYGAGDEDAVVALLEEALTDPRARGDEAVSGYLDALVDAYCEQGRERDAIETLTRIAGLEPAQGGTITDTVAGLHALLDESDAALRLLRGRHAEQERLPAGERDLDFYASAAMTIGELIGDRELALAWLSEGLRLALRRDDREHVLLLRMLQHRLMPAGKADHGLGEEADRRLRQRVRVAGRPQRKVARAAYFPEAEYVVAWEKGLLDPTQQPRHEDYRRELQETMQEVAARQGASVFVVPLEVAGLLEFAAGEGRDPARRQTRLDYSLSLPVEKDVSWPPERNAPCWCGSGRKYKKCCSAPGFLRVRVPDPASLVLRVELDGLSDPVVWRRVAVPSNTSLDQVHQIINSAMGWYGEHMYVFESEEHTIIDPRSDSHEPKADGKRLVSLAAEQGAQFRYVYDLGEEWTHTVTVEEVRKAAPENVPAVLDGGGACPPEDCGGVPGYLALVEAWNDPADPRHTEALDWLGKDFDPAVTVTQAR